MPWGVLLGPRLDFRRSFRPQDAAPAYLKTGKGGTPRSELELCAWSFLMVLPLAKKSGIVKRFARLRTSGS
jgi:hypothetical protein